MKPCTTTPGCALREGHEGPCDTGEGVQRYELRGLGQSEQPPEAVPVPDKNFGENE